MKEILSKIRHNQDNIFKGFVILLSITAICYVFPREGKFKYEFQKGKPWLHADLIAPFDFPIYKSVSEVEQEENEIRTKSRLIFRLQPELSDAKIADFKNEFEKVWTTSGLSEKSNFPSLKNLVKNFNNETTSSNSAVFYEFGENLLTEIYEKGIIKLDEVIENKPQELEITVLTKNISEEKKISDFHTIQSAYALIDNKLNELDRDVKKVMAPLLENALVQNVIYDEKMTITVLNDALNSVSLTRDAIQKDQKIIGQGEVVSEEMNDKLSSFKKEYQERLGISANYNFILSGQILLISIIIMILVGFLYLFRKDIFLENDKVAFILLMITAMVYMAAISNKFPQIDLFILPFCILPVLMRTFFDVRLAIFTHIITTLIVSFLAPNSFEFLFLQIVAGIVSIYFIVNIRKRSQIFVTSLIIFISYTLSYLGFSVIQEGDIESINYNYIGWFGINAMFTLSTYPLMYVFEKTFSFLSDVTLMELSDTNSPLLRSLAEKAPGTFQHSLQVANLAEEAVHQVGGNPLLIRTGALYHDIGKMKNPAFFIENQSGTNPHDQLDPMRSSQIIVSHVLDGLEMAKKHRLPEEIIDFIRTHHGTSTTGYFYNTYKKQYPEKEVDKKDFSYPGPVPFSKETAILMMSDAVEAASRSLKKPDEEAITNLVTNIIDHQANDGQFINADITFKDISTIKKIFIRKLLNIYHVRIEYPK